MFMKCFGHRSSMKRKNVESTKGKPSKKMTKSRRAHEEEDTDSGSCSDESGTTVMLNAGLEEVAAGPSTIKSVRVSPTVKKTTPVATIIGRTGRKSLEIAECLNKKIERYNKYESFVVYYIQHNIMFSFMLF